MKILIVEDHADLARAWQLLLRAIGHEVVTAKDGAASIAVAAMFRPEVVFLDLHLPYLNGYEVARELRKLPGLAAARIVLISGSPTVSVGAARDAGCDALVRKPAALSALLAAMHGARASVVADLRPSAAAAACAAPRA